MSSTKRDDQQIERARARVLRDRELDRRYFQAIHDGWLEVRRDRAGFVRKSAKLAALSNVYLGLILFVLVGLVGLMIGFTVAVGRPTFLVVFAAIVVGSALHQVLLAMFPKKEEERQGYTPEQLPGLFAELDQISKELGSIPVRDVEVVTNGSIAIARMERPAGPQGKLILDFPTMLNLTPDQLRGVLIHEISHIRRGTYEVALGLRNAIGLWSRLLYVHGPQSWLVNWMLSPFAKGYLWRLYAASHTIEQMHEYDADQAALDRMGSQTMIETTVRIALTERRVDDLWVDGIRKECIESGKPPRLVYEKLIEAMRQPLSSEAIREELVKLLKQEKQPQDIHPSFRERIANFGMDMRESPIDRLAEMAATPAVPSSAESFLGDQLKLVVDTLEFQHGKDWGPWWEREVQLEKEAAEARRALAEDDLSETQALDLLYKQHGKTFEAELKALAERYPHYAQVQARWALYRLDHDDPTGVGPTLTIVEQLPEWAERGYHALAEYYGRLRQEDQAQAYGRMADERRLMDEAVGEVASRVGPKDRLVPAAPDAADLQQILDVVSRTPRVEHAYVFTREIGQENARVSYILILTKRSFWTSDTHQEEVQDAVSTSITLHGNWVVYVPPSGDFAAWKRRLAKMPGALIWSRPK